MPNLERIAKIKREVDRLNREAVQSDAQKKMLLEENKRIKEFLREEQNVDIKNSDQGYAIKDELDESLDNHAEEMVKVLREIGVNI